MQATITYNAENGYLYVDHGNGSRVGIPVHGSDVEMAEGVRAIAAHAKRADEAETS